MNQEKDSTEVKIMEENIKVLDELINILLSNKLIIPWQKKYANRLGDIFIKYNICKKNKNKYEISKKYLQFLDTPVGNSFKEVLVSYSDINNLISEYIVAKEKDIKTEKYKILKSSALSYNHTYVYKIEALKDFIINDNLIHKGDIGGYIESENNLCQNDYSWICKGSIASGKSKVKNNSFVGPGVDICNNVIIDNTSIIKIPNKDINMSFDKTIIIRNNAQLVNCDVQGDIIFINDNARISDSKIYGEQIRIIRNPIINDSTIRSKTFISDNSFIEHSQIIESIINGYVEIYNESFIINSHISESIWLDKVYVSSSQIKGNKKIQNINLYKYYS